MIICQQRDQYIDQDYAFSYLSDKEFIMDTQKQQTDRDSQVKQALQDIRPALQNDGGDVEFVSMDADGKVMVRLVGSCAGCPMSQMTLKHGIERYLKDKIGSHIVVESET